MRDIFEKLNKYAVAPIVAILGTVYGFYIDNLNKTLEANKTKLDMLEQTADMNLKQKQFDEDLKFKLFTEVKDALSQNDTNQQKAIIILINEMLADDTTYRSNLINVLSHTSSPAIKKAIETQKKEESRFRSENVNDKNTFTVDVIYLEETKSESKPLAEKASTIIKQNFPAYSIRLRMLPQTINARRKFLISTNEIRCETDELDKATAIQKLINQDKLLPDASLAIHQVSDNSPNRISVFIRNN
jgi:hypothetical protein